MKKFVILFMSLILLFSALNIGASKQFSIESSSNEDIQMNSVLSNKLKGEPVMQDINGEDVFFTENRGQVGNESVRYYIQDKGVWFLDDGVMFEIKESTELTESWSRGVGGRESEELPNGVHHKLEPENRHPIERVVLKLNFEGCNEVEPKGVGLLPHRSNFFYGNDSSKWCMNVPNFQEIFYKNLYDNIDLRYYNSDKGLKYDFIVRPGGDPNDIILRYEGAQDLYIDPTGNLVIHTPMLNIIDSELFIYQNTQDIMNKIEGTFKILNSKTYGFEVSSDYDRNEILVIDPIIYSSFIGGSNIERCNDIVVDSNGNAIITGWTWSNDFPTTTGANDTTHNGVYDVFVIKFNHNGSSLLYSTFIGGISYDMAYSISIDSGENVYVTGDTWSSNFPTTAGAYDPTFNDGVDVFVFKLNSLGSLLMYSTYIGGNDPDYSRSIAIDSTGNVYLTGYTWSQTISDFPTTPGAYQTLYWDRNDLFVVKLNPAGNGQNDLKYSTFVNSDGEEYGFGIAVDVNGYIYVTGYTRSSQFPTTSKAFDKEFNGGDDAFVFKLNPAGNSFNDLVYSTFIGGLIDERSWDITVDLMSNVYITGYTDSEDFPMTANAYNTELIGNHDVFVLKLNSTGQRLLYSTYVGGSDWDYGIGISIDDDNNAYITGYTDSIDFSNIEGTNGLSRKDNYDVFVFKLNSVGSSILYSTILSGNNDDYGFEIAIDSNSNAYVTGNTSSANFPYTTNANDSSYNGGGDGFVVKLMLNHFPSIVDLKVSQNSILRTNSIYLYSNATDFEDSEHNLTPFFEYRGPNEQVWDSTDFSKPQYKNSRWEVSFTPTKNAALGLYDIRVRFNDTGVLFSDWGYLDNSLMVMDNIPTIENIFLSNNSVILGDEISIWVDSIDIEEPEEKLTVKIQYKDPSNQIWDTTYLNAPNYSDDRWECVISIPFEAPFGYYDLKARVNDSDGGYSNWVYLNNSLLVCNTQPKVIDIKLSNSFIYRTNSLCLFINSTDHETPEHLLKFYAQSKHQSKNNWVDLTSEYSNMNNNWNSELVTYINSYLGSYDFRMRFEDNESASSGWTYLNDSFEVLNNPPVISDDLDDIEVAIERELIDLTQYESDIEDDDKNLIWSVDENQVLSYIESVSIIDTIDDLLEIKPLKNVSGTEDITLTLTDKDGGTALKTDITIIFDSRITEQTPKVTLKSPLDTSIVNTLTPTLEWNLDYSGEEIITFTIYYDNTPDFKQEQKSGLTTTTYKLEEELEDGKKYYWKVIPEGGFCLSEPFSFTVNLSFEPSYYINIAIDKNYITVTPDESLNVTLTITNEGNVLDEYIIDYSISWTALIEVELSKTFLALEPNNEDQITALIIISKDIEPGEYNIRFTVKSEDASDETLLTLYVEDVSGGESKEDNNMLYAGIGIAIIIIVIVLVLLFLFIYKPKLAQKQAEIEYVPQVPSKVQYAPPQKVPKPETIAQTMPLSHPQPRLVVPPQSQPQNQPTVQPGQPPPNRKTVKLKKPALLPPAGKSEEPK